ncbi:HupE/UreJ family protein [Ensifer sp. LC54]|uniref:HupE/UreJ family protein n=1 Tax=Ensifer sp. LC54 TaxID=1873715 RepID=UPI000812EAA5|nr:HupE/UreJ family protein [Ensifer sp. LC54]OCP24812.1 hypothetical protein BC361_19595 [Ensifer sp. LC54]OCP25849.1 hypothetical protein BC363_18940 [Ensifer sp. LC384]
MADLELPESDIPFALLFFKVGMEIGQLMFIAAVIAAVAVVRLVRYLPFRVPGHRSPPRWNG